VGKDFSPEELQDFIFDLSGGVNNDVAPLLLAKNQLGSATNTTVRGTFALPRPPVRKIALDSDSESVLAAALALGPYQGGTYYLPDDGGGRIRIAVGGRLIELTPSALTATATYIPTPGGDNPPALRQAWLWQSEKWTIWNDGVSNPVFTDDTTSIRSNYTPPIPFNDTVGTAFNVAAIDAQQTIAFTTATGMVVGDILTITGIGLFKVLDISTAPSVLVLNLSGAPENVTVGSGTTVEWSHQGNQLPPGRMGAYIKGRNWISLVDGRQFVASDLVGGSSGTQANNYRDAVLYITENYYLFGGGNFIIPAAGSRITAIRGAAILDVSLGQGPVQVFTTDRIFTCQAPVDRLAWQSLNTPILTEAVIDDGAEGQYSTINANSDIIYRSPDGMRSETLARREFQTWGNVPISQEVQPLLDKDSPDLLPWGSAIIFDNRLLMTASPASVDQGVYWRALIPLNFDPISSLRGKEPSVYDSLAWTGLNVLQLFVGKFSGVNRAFAVGLNTDEGKIELYEILKSSVTDLPTPIIRDNQDTSEQRELIWTMESPCIFKYQPNDHRAGMLKRLMDGEIYVDDIKPDSTVEFNVFYKPDQWPCWVPWFKWKECAGPQANQFRPRMGLGEPSPTPCDGITDRPLREGFTFRVMLTIVGHCRFLGGRFRAVTCPQPRYSPQACTPICP
jgi:hypothetical protein